MTAADGTAPKTPPVRLCTAEVPGRQLAYRPLQKEFSGMCLNNVCPTVVIAI